MKLITYSVFLGGIMACFAQASTISFVLNQDACGGTCGTNPFGTIIITDNGLTGASAAVTVTETLISTDAFVHTGAGDSMEFQLLGAGTVLISSLTTGFTATSGTQTASALGSFSNGITCSGCGNGSSNPLPGPLSFVVGSNTGVTTADFVANSNGDYFASDILGSNGKTGNVGADSYTVTNSSNLSATPEPGSLFLAAGAVVVFGLVQLRKISAVQRCL